MLNVNVINAKSTQKVEVKPGQPTHLKVDANTRLELVDSASGKAPTQIKARRVGDNLEIVTDEKAQIEDTTASNAQAPDLVLEDYFKQADVSLYAGTGQEAVSYVPVDGAASSSYAAMFTSATTGAALAAAPLLSPWMGVAAGAGVAAAAGGGGGGGGTPVANQAPVAKDDTKSVTENGSLEGAVPSATDADGTVASYRLVGDVASGKLTFNADGSYSFDANQDFDNLADGQTKEVSFTYSAVDNAGGVSAPKTVTITVTGTNDAPVASAATKSVDEGMKVDGSVTATDADAGATLKYALVGAAPAGLTFKEDGTYSFDAGDAAYDSLKAGETKDVVVKFKANDGVLDSAEQTLTIKVKGVNDDATIHGIATGDATEDAITTVNGSLSVSDVDAGQAVFEAPASLQGTYGTYTFNASSGAWTYTLDNTKAEVQALTAGQTVVDRLVVKSLDGTASQSIDVTITGANDAATISGTGTGAVTEDAGSANVASGTLAVSDVDAGQAVFEAPASLQGTYGTYTFNASSGAWTYTLDNTKAEVQALTAGQTVVDRLVVKSLDGTASQSIDVTITGANDSPTISVTVGDSDAASMNSNFTQEIGGSLTFNDVDADGWTMHGAGVRLGETSTFDFANQLTAEQQSLLMSKLQNCFTLHAVAAEDMNQNNNQHWSFKTESASDFDFLPNNKTLVVEYEVSVTDAHGASGTHIVSITVTGKHTNEAPQILIDEGDAQSAELIEANAILSTSGTLTVADPDVGDVCMVKVMGVNFDGSTTFDPAALSPARLESLTASVLNWLNVPEQLDGQTPHNLTWNFNSVGNANLEWLEANEKLVLNYTIEVQDTAGAKASQVVSITIVGTDDQPAIAVLGTDAAYVVVVESPTQVDAAGTLSVNFGDRTESARLAVSGAHINLEKSLFPETLTTEDVAALETALQNRLQLWVDGTTPDGLHNVNWSLDLGGLLPEGATLALDYTFDLFNLVNGTVYGQQVVSVSISGVNDAPVVDLIGTDNDQTSFFETDSILTSSGTFSISDLDYKDAVTFEVKKVVFDAPFLSPEQLALMESAFKSFLTLSSAGSMDDFHNLKWTFNSSYSNNLDFIPEGESFYVYYTVEVKDAAGATAQKDVSVYIFGTNDAPVIQVQEGDSDQIGLTESGTSLVATGTVTLKDADYNAQVNFAVSDVALDPLVPSFLTVEQFSAIKSQLMGFMSLTALGTLDDSHNLQWTFDTTGGLNAGFIPMGETLALDYTIEAIDNKGAITTQVIHIDILGSNSAPTFELIGSDSVAASLIETDDVLKASGTMSLMDLDSNDPSNATRISVNVNGYSGGYDNAHFLNLLKLSTETNGNGEPLLVNDPHNVRWTFESTSAGDFDYLAKDQILKLEYTIEAKDSHGATSQQLVSITVTGTNDAPQVLIFAGDSAEGSVVSPTQDVTGSLSIFDEEVVAASFAGIQLDGVNITNEATQSMLFGLLRIDPTSTFETVNEPNNFDWRFKTADAVAQGWTSNLPDGNHKLTYTMDFMDTYGVQQKQDINIFFIV